MTYGRTIEEYHIGRLLGRGSFGDVYEATCRHSSKRVAVKMISKQLLQNQGMMERVVREVEIHCQLRHPHIVELFEYFEDVTRVYFVMELCARGELLTLLREKGRVDLASAKVYFRQLVSGVEYLHSQSILHRDLKLSNLLLTRDWTLKIADFGLAAALGGGDAERRTICGTPNYMCPEIVAHEPYTLAADLWSLGVTLYTFLTGFPPFQSDAVQGTLQRVGSCDYQCPSDMPPDAAHLISELLQKDPKRRLSLSAIKKHPFLSGTTAVPVLINASLDRHDGPPSPEPSNILPHRVAHPRQTEPDSPSSRRVLPAGGNNSLKKNRNTSASQAVHVAQGGGSKDLTHGENLAIRDCGSKVYHQSEVDGTWHGEETEVMETARTGASGQSIHGSAGSGRADDLPDGDDELVEGELQEMSSSVGGALESVASLEGMLGEGPEGRTLPTKPLNTAHLRPLRHEMAYGSLSILEDGQVCVEHRGVGKIGGGRGDGEVGVESCMFYVSKDGLDVRVERRGRTTRHHRFPFLPEALVAHYAHATAFVSIVAAATPKVVYVSERAQATCMENGDLQVAFTDRGPVMSVHMTASNGSASVIAADGTVYTLPSLHSRPSDVSDTANGSASGAAHLPGLQDKGIWDAFSHARRCHRRCTEAEARAHAQNPAKSFPLVARSRRLKSSSRPPLADTTPLNMTSSSYTKLLPTNPETTPQPLLRTNSALSESFRSLALSSSHPFPAAHIVQSIQHSVTQLANNSSGSVLSGDLSSGSSNSSSSFHVPPGGGAPSAPLPSLPPRRLKPLQSPVSPLSPNPSMQSGPSDRSMPCSPLGTGARSSTAGYPRGSHDSLSACAPLDAGTDHSMGSCPRTRPHLSSSSDEHNWLSTNGSDASGSLTGSDLPSRSLKSWPMNVDIHSGGEMERNGGWSVEELPRSQARSSHEFSNDSASHRSEARRLNGDIQAPLSEQCMHGRSQVPRPQSASWDRVEMLDFSGRRLHHGMPPQHGSLQDGDSASGWEDRWRRKGGLRVGHEACVPGVPPRDCRHRYVQADAAKDKHWDCCFHCQSDAQPSGQHLYGGCGHCRSCGEVWREERDRCGRKGCSECGSHSQCCCLRQHERRETVSRAGRGECSLCGGNANWEHVQGGVTSRAGRVQGQRHLQEKRASDTPIVCSSCFHDGRYGRSSVDLKGQKGTCVTCREADSEMDRQRLGKVELFAGRGADSEMHENVQVTEFRGRTAVREIERQVVSVARSATSPSPMLSTSRQPVASFTGSLAEDIAPSEGAVDVRIPTQSYGQQLPLSGLPPVGTSGMHAADSPRQREQPCESEWGSSSQRVSDYAPEDRSSRISRSESSLERDRLLAISTPATRIRPGNGQELQGGANQSASARGGLESHTTARASIHPELRSPGSGAQLDEWSDPANGRLSGVMHAGESLQRDRPGPREVTLEELRQSDGGRGEALESHMSQESWNGRQSAYFPGVGWAIRLASGELLMHYLDDAQMVVTADGASVEYWSPGGAATGQRYDLTIRNSIPSEVRSKLQHLAAFIRLLKKQPPPSTSQAGAEVTHECCGK